MFHFHLTRYWFEQFRDGYKSFEYRVATPREVVRLNRECFGRDRIPCRLYCDYPKKDDSSKILNGFVNGARFVRLYDLPQAEKQFFLNRTDDENRINDNTLFVEYWLDV